MAESLAPRNGNRYGDTLVQPVRLERDGKTGLLIIDMQYRDVPDPAHHATEMRGWMDAVAALRPADVEQYNKRMADTVIPTIQRLLLAFRADKLPVVHTVFGSERPDYGDVPATLRGVVRKLESSSGIEGFIRTDHPAFRIRAEVQPVDGEKVLQKSTWSGFEGTGLDALLRQMGVENLVITGVTSPGCVGATARHAADLGYRSVIVADGTADEDHELHELSLRLFHRKFGRVVESAEGVIAAMAGEWGV
jgi:nicotinamidase-related amidase